MPYKGIYVAIWVISTLGFFSQAYFSIKQTSISLPREEQTLTPFIISLGQSYGLAFNNLKDTYNASVTALEDSARSSAWFTLWLNLISGFFSLAGLVVSILEYREEYRRNS